MNDASDTFNIPGSNGTRASESGRNSVLDRLAARDAARIADITQRAAHSRIQENPAESAPAFWLAFESQRALTEGTLDTLAARTEDGCSDVVKTALADVSATIDALDKRVAESSYFLPQYDLRQATAAAAALHQRLADVAAALQPRRRFGFSRAVKKSALREPQPLAEQNPSQDSQQGRTDGGAGEGKGEARGSSSSVPQQAERVQGRGTQGLRGQTLVLHAEELGNGDYMLSDLSDCNVWLLGGLSALRMTNLLRCNIYSGPVAGATFVEGAKDCTFMLASHQVRVHAAHCCDLYLRVRSNPIIEDCTSVGVAPYALDVVDLRGGMESAGLAAESGLWNAVQDFLWLRSTPSPNWHLIAEPDRRQAPELPSTGVTVAKEDEPAADCKLIAPLTV